MISLLYLISALILGASLTSRLGFRLFAFEFAGFAILLGLMLWTWLSFLLSLALPISLSLPLTTAISGVVSFWIWRQPVRPQKPLQFTTHGTRLVWGAFTAISLSVIGWLMWTHNLIPISDSLYSANAAWADLGVHASLISHFAASPRLDLELPIAAGAPLTYPFMVDLLSAWLVVGGWSLQLALFVPSILFVFAFLQLFIGFGQRLFGSTGGAIAGLALMLLCGSAAGLFIAASDLDATRVSLLTFLSHIPRDYAIMPEPNTQLGNFIASVILPQRTFVMGMAVVAGVLILLTRLSTRPSRQIIILIGLLIGLLPLIHAHSFLVLAALLLGLWVHHATRTRRFRNSYLTTGLIAITIALPQILWQTLGSERTGTGGHFSLGWALQSGETLLGFWMNNFGLTLVLMIVITIALLARRSLRHYLAWYLPLMGIFALTQIYSLQPFEYDNHKLIHYVYLFTYLFVGYGAVWLIRQKKLLIIPILILGLVISGTGILAVTREFQSRHLFASADDLALATWAQKTTQTSDVFFAADRPNQPLATIAGRKLVAGYRGWLYNYNLNYEPRIAAIQNAFQGQATLDNPYDAKYVAINQYEAPEWLIAADVIEIRYKQVYKNPSWTVYELPSLVDE